MHARQLTGLFLLFSLVQVALFGSTPRGSGEASDQPALQPTPVDGGSGILAALNDEFYNTYPRQDDMVLPGINADLWYTNSYPFRGKGIGVGILDRGFDGLNTLPDSIDYVPIPPNLADTVTGTSHGTNVLKVAASIAPEATFFLCSYVTLDQFRACVETLIDKEIQVVIHSAAVPYLPRDGTSEWSRLVKKAHESGPPGVVWVNSAGNSHNGIYEGTINLNKAHRNATQYEHIFDLNDGTTESFINLEASTRAEDTMGKARLYLTWNSEPLMDQALLKIKVTFVETQRSEPSILIDDTPGHPVEMIEIPLDQEVEIRIVAEQLKADGVNFALITDHIELDKRLQTSPNYVLVPADSPYVVAVGALHSTEEIATYSSCGTFDFLPEDQLPETPPLSITKPDIVTFAELELNDGSGDDASFEFLGTSAAAPIVGGAVALLRQAYPSLGPNEVRAFLYNFATKADVTQPNSRCDKPAGYGRLWLPSPPPEPVTQPVDVGELPPPYQPANQPLANSPFAIINVPMGNLRSGPQLSCLRLGSGVNEAKYPIVGKFGDWYQVEAEVNGNIQQVWVYKGIVNIEGDERSIKDIEPASCSMATDTFEAITLTAEPIWTIAPTAPSGNGSEGTMPSPTPPPPPTIPPELTVIVTPTQPSKPNWTAVPTSTPTTPPPPSCTTLQLRSDGCNGSSAFFTISNPCAEPLSAVNFRFEKNVGGTWEGMDNGRTADFPPGSSQQMGRDASSYPVRFSADGVGSAEMYCGG